MKWNLRMALAVLLCLSGSARADVKMFTLSGGVTLALEEISDEAGVMYQAMRLNRALNVWNVEVLLTNLTDRTLEGPFVLLVESSSGTTGLIASDGTDDSSPAKPYYELSDRVAEGRLAPGEKSLPRTLSLGVQSGQSPQLTVRVYALGRQTAALGLVRSLDEAGLPLAMVEVEEAGPGGQVSHQTDEAPS
jgi:hypothetical protein